MIQRKPIPYFRRLALAAVVPLSLFASGCTTARIPVTGFEVPVPNIPLPAVLRGENDLRGRTWSKAFQILHDRLEREYAYSQHKGINWDSLYEKTAAEVLAAEENKDRAAWYRAVRSYLFAIPDSNVTIDPNDVLRDADVGASAGLALAPLSDGTVIVVGLLPDSPAEAAGIEWGATILSWDGEALGAALPKANVLWADSPASTPDGRRRQQLDWLTRGPVDSTHTIGYMNPGATSESTTTLSLAKDRYETMALSRPLWTPVELFDSPIKTHILGENYRYLRVAAIAPTLSTPFPSRDFKAAVRLAQKEASAGIIIDLRGTQGGDGTLVPVMLQPLVEAQSFLEIPGVWDSELELYLVESEETVYVTPEEPLYLGHIVVLVDDYTMGPAESMAGFLKGKENVRIFGESGTGAAPGLPTVDLTLPGGYSVMYPARRSLNEAGEIQGASDGSGVGGVIPDAFFTLDRSNAVTIYQDGKDAVLEKAIEMLDSSTWRFP
tara:strand:- start:491 stop:1975 length:1485 start_codon:yes stop_codon:yes gene_type:complete